MLSQASAEVAKALKALDGKKQEEEKARGALEGPPPPTFLLRVSEGLSVHSRRKTAAAAPLASFQRASTCSSAARGVWSSQASVLTSAYL